MVPASSITTVCHPVLQPGSASTSSPGALAASCGMEKRHMQHSLEAPRRAGAALTLVARGQERGSAGSTDPSLAQPLSLLCQDSHGHMARQCSTPRYAGLGLKGPCTTTTLQIMEITSDAGGMLPHPQDELYVHHGVSGSPVKLSWTKEGNPSLVRVVFFNMPFCSVLISSASRLCVLQINWQKNGNH